MEWVYKGVFIGVSYLLGAIPTGYIVGKVVRKIDIREHGSGNVGATNVLRVVGKRWGIFVFTCDILKGIITVVIWKYVSDITGGPELSRKFLFVCGLIAIMGHNWTIFLNFKGGKGVATTVGVLLGLFPITLLLSFAIAAIVIWITRYVSVGSIVGCFIFPVVFALRNHTLDDFKFLMTIIIIMAFMMLFKHRSNMKRLLKGEENKSF